MRPTRPERLRGFTLIELIVGITVLGVLSMIVVPLLRMPTVAYLEARSRTELQSQADLLRGKLAADLGQALPGSLRVTQAGGIWYLEFLQLRGWGRYRYNSGGPGACPATPANCPASATAGANEFKAACATETCFTTIGDIQLSAAASPPVNTDFVVIDPAFAGSNVYNAALGFRSRVTAYATAQVLPPVRQISFLANAFPSAGTDRRFYVVSQAVTYVCDPAAGTLTRRWGYAIQTLQPTAFAGAVSSALVSNRIGSCGANPNQPRVLPLPTAGGLSTGSQLEMELELRQTVPGQPDEAQPVWIQVAVREPS